MHLTMPQSGQSQLQVRITVRHPEWQTTAQVDDSHKTLDLLVPEGINPDEVEVFAEFIGVDGQPDPRFSVMPLKEKVAHVEQTSDAGKSGESHSDEHHSDGEHTEDSTPSDAGVEGDAESVGEAEDEQDAGTKPSQGEVTHHKSRRPKHA
jgi:hypothetical protein